MNLIKDRASHAQLRDDEIVLVENAIRLAIDSIINVLCGVNGARTHEYQRVVAEKDKEIQRLETRLKRIEDEQRVLRRHGCACSLDTGSSRIADDQLHGVEIGFEPVGMDAQATAAQPECDIILSLGLFGRPPSQISSQSHESAPPSSPSRTCLDQTCTTSCSESSGVLLSAKDHTLSPNNLVVKEEPRDIDAVPVKSELTDDRFKEHQESADGPYQEEESFTGNEYNNETHFREYLQADPGSHHIVDGGNHRNKKRSIPMAELPEEAQRLKRAAWRAASRRYYARKIARQQANPAQPHCFSHIAVSKYSHTHLSEESQMMQREAWRAASKRYYAKKVARHQANSMQYGHLLQNMESLRGKRQAEQAGSHGNTDGILCS